jgi:acetyl esterase
VSRLRRARHAVSVGGFHGWLRAGALATSAVPVFWPRVQGVDCTRGVRYGELTEQTLDVYRDRAAAADPRPRPAMLYAHGGAFRNLSSRTHWMMGVQYARAGFVVFNVNYRLAPKHRFPAALTDVAAAYEWVAAHGVSYGADPSRIVVAGESAGANLITALTLAACRRYDAPDFAPGFFDRVRPPVAAIAGCGLLQVSDADRLARRRPLPWWIADNIRDCEMVYLPAQASYAPALADPLLELERIEGPEALDRPLPPTFAFVGTRDPVLDDTRRLGRVLERLDVPGETRIYEGAYHAFHAIYFEPTARRCWADQRAFLARYASSSGGSGASGGG